MMMYNNYYNRALRYSAYEAVKSLGHSIFRGNDLDKMPILADALEESDQHADDETLHHLRNMGSEGKTPILTFTKDNKIKVRPKPDKVHIQGKKWFDPVNGNTYHTAEIHINGVPKFKTERTYGYGNQYVWSGLQKLAEEGYIPSIIPANPHTLRNFLGEDNFTYDEENVNRKKDL